ncbi:circadian-associated transcriptional repressor [Hoplias malabaricus]|uniref:circadian-associated transcriptional repressor n=1 Tax=Hoplias malabaricus TaxID=27720 RepID=UPI003462369D
MSASDSDYSIDWLASDDEEDNSEVEAKCERIQGMLSSARAAEVQTCKRTADNSVKDKVARSSRSSSPSSCTSSCCSTEGELSPPGESEDRSGYNHTSESPKGKNRQARKRAWCSAVPEQKERQLTTSPTEKDRFFACKCIELQCYIHPLSSILNGLRSGRYRERLSTFQESVAMDRIQRIMGVLQNPCMGERYVNIILKMEEMLKSWFPHVKPRQQTTAVELTQETAPLKKPKLSSAAVPMSTGLVNPATNGAPHIGAKAMRVSDLTPPAPYSATNLKWFHTSPICSPTAEQVQGTVRNFLTAHTDKDITQDNSVSSSTDMPQHKTNSMPSRPPPGKINAPCLERLLKSTESIISQKGSGGMGGMSAPGWS